MIKVNGNKNELSVKKCTCDYIDELPATAAAQRALGMAIHSQCHVMSQNVTYYIDENNNWRVLGYAMWDPESSPHFPTTTSSSSEENS